MSVMNSLLKRTVAMLMSQTQSFFDHILPLFRPVEAMDARVLILEMLWRCAKVVLSWWISLVTLPIHAAHMDVVSLHIYQHTWSPIPLVMPLYRWTILLTNHEEIWQLLARPIYTTLSMIMITVAMHIYSTHNAILDPYWIIVLNTLIKTLLTINQA